MGKHEVRRRAVFLDRDGVLNRPVVREGRPCPPQSVDEFALYDGVAEACTMLKDAGFLLIVVTNQPDVGRGTQSRAAVEAMHTKLRTALQGSAPAGVNYRFSLTYRSEELRQKWVASPEHQRVWPTIENTLTSKNYTVLLFDVN